MEVSITKHPDYNCPNPVENCIEFCFFGNNIDTEGEKASLLILINEHFHSITNLTTFTLLDQTFKVDFSSPYAAASFNGTTPNWEAAFDNFVNMLRANFLFANMTITAERIDTFGSINIVNNEIGLQENWVFDFQNLINETVNQNGAAGIASIVTNGEDIVFVDGYRIWWQLYCQDEGQDYPVYPLQSAEPFVRSDNTVLDLCLDFSHDVKGLVKTTLPNLSMATPTLDDTILKTCYIKYGYFQTNPETGCGTVYGLTNQSDPFQVINFAYQADDPDGFAPHCKSAGTNLVKFLTLQPRRRFVCRNSYHFLWIYLDVIRSKGGNATVQYHVRTIKKTDGAETHNTLTTFATADGAYIIPVRFQNEQNDTLIIRIEATVTIAGIPTQEIVSEDFTFLVRGNTGCENVDLLFLSSKGGYDTLSCHERGAIELVSEMTEICRNVKCGSAYSDQLKQDGKSHVNGRSYEKITLQTDLYLKNEELLNWYKDFKASESKFIITKDLAGQSVIRRFLVEPGTLKIWEKDKKLKITFSGRYNADYKKLSES